MIGIAVFGAGKAATIHMRGWQTVKNARMIGVYDPNGERARAAANTFGIEAFSSPEALLRAPGVDAADVATSNDSHRAMARLAASHGKAVLCQKPLSISLEDAEGLVRDCEDAGIRMMANENWRWRPWYRVAKQVIGSGRLGRLIAYRSHFSSPLQTYPLILNVGPHQLDVCRYLFGEADSVYARALIVTPNRTVEDAASVSLGFDGGTRMAQVNFNFASVLPKRFQQDLLQIDGSEAALSLDTTGEMKLTLRGGEIEPVPVDGTDYYQRSFTSALEHFAAALEAGTPFETPGRENLNTMRLVFGAYRSLKEGRPVTLS